MNSIFITTNEFTPFTGGGKVSIHESKALEQYSDSITRVSRKDVPSEYWGNPFQQDAYISTLIDEPFDVVHFNGNPFHYTLQSLKYFNPDIKVVSSVPAHNLDLSVEEHYKLGIPYGKHYPHMVYPELWEKYIHHINLSDLVITPSKMSKIWLLDLPLIQVEENKVSVIPHGCDIPSKVPDYPSEPSVGYVGAGGVDKGIIYLVEAWNQLDYSDIPLRFYGTGSEMARQYTHGKNGVYEFRGRYQDITDVASEISFAVFPSVTEAFNLCALELASCGRGSVLSENVGASEYIPHATFRVREVTPLISMIRQLFIDDLYKRIGRNAKLGSKMLTWDIVEAKYIEKYEELMNVV
jgi:glycosyltransferase involved in cell wall biosynthesis